MAGMNRLPYVSGQIVPRAQAEAEIARRMRRLAQQLESNQKKTIETNLQPKPQCADHQFEDQHVFSCEGAYDVVDVLCTACGAKDYVNRACAHDEQDRAEARADANPEAFE